MPQHKKLAGLLLCEYLCDVIGKMTLTSYENLVALKWERCHIINNSIAMKNEFFEIKNSTNVSNS